MQGRNQWVAYGFLVGALVGGSITDAVAQADSSPPAYFYTLLDGSRLVDDCPICDRVPIVKPMKGSFQLRLIQENPLFATYAFEAVCFTAGDTNGPNYRVTGKGTYQIDGEVALLQELSLEATVNDGLTNKLCYFTNAVAAVNRLWPMLQVNLDQTNGTETQTFHLEIAAAPFREIWFSTVQAFKAGIWNPPTNAISGGDLICSTGRAIKRNQELTRNLGIMPPVPDLGLKDLDVLVGGEIGFSIESDVWSESLGTELRTGDFLSDQGRVLRTGGQLLAAFAPKPALPDGAGLCASQLMDNGQLYFSVQTNFFSSALDRTIQTGDLLSDAGTLIRTGAALIGKFNPAAPTNDCGLRAVYVWPSGELWFATRDGFYDVYSNYYGPGDLLSDQGYVVYRNSELLLPFQVSGTAAELGLDGLFVISDITPTPRAATLSLGLSTLPTPGSLSLERIGGSRAFQLERATNASGQYVPAGPITTDAEFLDAGALTNRSQGFYRLHQW